MPSQTALELRTSRTALADGLGIDGPFIDRLVDRFYSAVRSDLVLAPIFASRVDDWEPHLARMKQFWRSILRAEGSFSGNPMLKHVVIPDIDAAEFERWLDLFETAVLAEAPNPGAAAMVTDRARSIAASLLAGVLRHRQSPARQGSSNGAYHA
ncbi:group III truncated hemoglobin [Qipengyuania sp. RANM35]|uniref:group III truncated hemoglobin n=1 Tax=Qipengyuania sp. RANM35 TaxID=3068635 RepID=UPI0034DAFA1E